MNETRNTNPVRDIKTAQYLNLFHSAKIILWPNRRPPRINDRINNSQLESTERVEKSYPFSSPSCWRETREKANESSRNQLTGRQVFDYGRGIGRAAIKLEINLTSSQHRRVPDSRAISRCFVVVSNRGYRLGGEGLVPAYIVQARSPEIEGRPRRLPAPDGTEQEEQEGSERESSEKGQTNDFLPSISLLLPSFSFLFLFLFPVFVNGSSHAQWPIELFGV